MIKVKITSDSGGGPYSETRWVANCFLNSDGKWKTHSGKTIEERFHTGMADCEVTVIKIKPQKHFIYT